MPRAKTAKVESNGNGENGNSENGLKRTSYERRVTLTETRNGIERMIYTVQAMRAYGEGPAVAMQYAIKGEADGNPRLKERFDKNKLSLFCTPVELDDTYTVYVGVIWTAGQCPVCGTDKDHKHDWCPGCNSSVEMNLTDMEAALREEFEF